MTSYQITRRFEFDAAHRVLNHESKCAHLHGHRYVAEVTVASDVLDNVSRVIDFSQVKKLVGEWIDFYWDHNIILHPDDPLLHALVPKEKTRETNQHDNWTGVVKKVWEGEALARHTCNVPIFGSKWPYVMPDGCNPTAEELARRLYQVSHDLLKNANDKLNVVKVRLYETPNCYAEWEPTI